ncbi:MAG: bifunctional [glutamine synthetase] adenylyltransferase/[glutamine synthetase]-adenylyl-L-tyrosine phosphorylase [Euzebya sp.]
MTAIVDLSFAANQDWASEALSRLDPASVPSSPTAEHRLAVVLGSSPALGDLLATRSALLAIMDEEPLPAWTAQDVTALALSAEPNSAALAGLQRRGVLRVATRDLLGMAGTEAAAFELSQLADGLLAAALQIVTDSTTAGDAELCVLGMGKLGGQELNYVSDVDVLFVHRGDTATAERIARTFLQLTGGHSPNGPVYEMDANLRPEGRNGALTRTVASYQAYYDRWAKTWEFQSLLKMRPVAGPQDLAAEFQDLVTPLVWPESLGSGAVDEIQAMKRRVEASTPVVKDGDRQIKLAPGGLRDIEFAVQLLQLVHGPADPELRQRGTMSALTALARGGYIDEGDANLFGDFYLFLRTVEHRLQLRHLRRTHTIPSDDAERQHLARTLGFRDLPTRRAQTEFEAELARVQNGVRRLHQQLFYRPLLGTIASWGSDQRVSDGGGLNQEAARIRLRALAFQAPGQALRHLEAMLKGSGRTTQQLRVVLPTMLEALSDTPDPDGGLAALRSLAQELRTNPRFLRTVRDNPAAARLLARILGRSPRLGEWFSRQPEVLRLCEEMDALERPRTQEELHAGAAGLVRRGGGASGADAMRRYKRREALRTAIRDVTEQADVVQVGHELTWLSEGLLQAAVATVGEGEGEGTRIAVIALGRFGAAELNHSSDLDVLFVHDGDTPAAERAAAAVIDLLNRVTPEGSAFGIDVGLRPEGRSGPLTRSLESHLTYYQRWGEHWELQAMTQARVVAGDADLGQAWLEGVRPLVYADPVDHDRLREVRRMKARLEVERAGGGSTVRGRVAGRGLGPKPRATAAPARGPRGDDGGAVNSKDVKLGPGGLSDVEWTVQLLALQHGGAHPELRGPGTLRVLGELAGLGLLSVEETEWMRSGWLLLSRLRNTLYLIGERDTSSIPSSHDRLTKLARAMHYESAQALTQDIDRARRRIRKAFDHNFFET